MRYIKSPTSYIQASHMYVNDPKIKKLLSSDVFEFMNNAYKWIGGFKSFTGEDDFADRSYLWYITYEGPLPEDEKDIDIRKFERAHKIPALAPNLQQKLNELWKSDESE